MNFETSPFFADLTFENEVGDVYSRPTKNDEDWLISTIRSLCKLSGKSKIQFEHIKNELSVRGFIKNIPAPSRSNLIIPSRVGSPFAQVFKPISEIGEGGYGKVFKIHNLIDKHQYALKVVDIEPDEASSAMKEVQCLAALNSPRTLRYYSSWISENENNKTLSLYIQTEFINGRNLADVLSKRSQVDYDFSMKITKELAKALVDIHSAGIVHRDFNPSNVILMDNGLVKVIDFGISSIHNYDDDDDVPCSPPSPHMGASSYTIRDIDRFCINAAETKSNSMAEGTPLYSSPRQLNGIKSSEKDDIYSFGIMIFELFSLFKTQMQKVKEIKALRNESKLPSEFEEKYPQIARLVKKMTEPRGKKRPSAFEILHSSLFEKK